MLNSLKARTFKALRIAITLTPWLISMYLFYWLDSSGAWTSETPHRGKISVGILAAGMGSSFLLQSYFARYRRATK